MENIIQFGVYDPSESPPASTGKGCRTVMVVTCFVSIFPGTRQYERRDKGRAHPHLDEQLTCDDLAGANGVVSTDVGTISLEPTTLAAGQYYRGPDMKAVGPADDAWRCHVSSGSDYLVPAQ